MGAMKNKVALVFPHQLFETSELINQCTTFILLEEELFFRQYAFHKSKLVFHTASMKAYSNYLLALDKEVIYIESGSEQDNIKSCIDFYSKTYTEWHCFDVCDDWLNQRLDKAIKTNKVKLVYYDSPAFLNSEEELKAYYKDKKRFFQTDFYIAQRKQRNLLMDRYGKPMGGKWSFDEDNRQRYPKGKNVPPVHFPNLNTHYKNAIASVAIQFKNNPGEANTFIYPTTFEEARQWLDDFLENRLLGFGNYEDAIVKEETVLHHSVLSPLINSGLLTPNYVIERILSFSEENTIPLNNIEGILRQVCGWREFIRAIYVLKGRQERTTNYWNHKRKLPKSFYTATTSIAPIDITIKKILKTGYCHHIERLMVLGNFMLLCEFDPDDVYQWFMEMFIDAYDWVMVPNVYGMSQFADGGIFATKPYISGSSYLMKMGNYEKGSWQEIWDALFWRFIAVHEDFFRKNPRLSMMANTLHKMNPGKREKHMTIAENYLGQLH